MMTISHLTARVRFPLYGEKRDSEWLFFGFFYCFTFSLWAIQPASPPKCFSGHIFFPYNLKLVLKKEKLLDLLWIWKWKAQYSPWSFEIKLSGPSPTAEAMPVKRLSFDTCHRHRCSLQQKVIYKPDNLKVFFIYI